MKKVISLTLSFFLLSMPLVSLAHPGHGETGGYTIIHYFIEPMHAVVTYSILFGTLAYIIYRRTNKQPKQNI